MSPRKNRRGPVDRRSADGAAPGGHEHTEEGPDGEWAVRMVAGAAKSYRCPGCDQEIPPGVGHVVAWPLDGRGADDRRHWHRSCWQARLRRSPRIPRSRNAPRY